MRCGRVRIREMSGFRLFFVEEEARVRVIAFARERRSRYWKKRLG